MNVERNICSRSSLVIIALICFVQVENDDIFILLW